MKARTCLWPVVLLLPVIAAAADSKWTDLGSTDLSRFFENRVAQLEDPLVGVQTLEQWKTKRVELRAQLESMLGLSPMPDRTPLHATITGTIEREDFIVEKLHFQSRPGLYVTANFYLPKERVGKIPAILYVCGHARVKVDGVSCGNKAAYQHHGIWFARNGYACLVIDTVQLGEIEGVHHGTYSQGRWWWNARGYTPAGVEAWNGIRSIDYLQSRPEVDGERIGITGRSGGGAYSWWVAALDERVTAAVPVAGITSLRNHVVDGCVEGHCDCMFMVNSEGWDFENVAALIAPRPLLISNTDKDTIFPLDGVYQVYREVRRIYDLCGTAGQLGLNIEEGPHKDTQPLRTSAFHWMNRHLKGTAPADTFEMAAVKVFEPQELKVFDEIPADEINTSIDEVFVPVAPAPPVPNNTDDWRGQTNRWMAALRRDCFHAWPEHGKPEQLRESDPITNAADSAFRGYRISAGNPASAWVAMPPTMTSARAKLTMVICDAETWEKVGEPQREDTVYLLPRGIGPSAWSEDPKKQIQIRRRFALAGLTLDAMRVWDIVQAVRVLRTAGYGTESLTLEACGAMAGNAVYASLFLDQPVDQLILHDLPASHRDGPVYLNILRHLDMPAAVAMAAERTKVALDGDGWDYPLATAKALGWPEGQVLVLLPTGTSPK